MARLINSTPLISVNAVGFDSETTGLETATARIVQMGAVMVEHGKIVTGQSFETLVNPGIAVPASSTAIHGITGEMVSGAPRFAAAWDQFEAFRNGRLLVGYALGFDLAVLEREAVLSGLDWRPPRSLCVRLLATVVNPRLTDMSLDGISSWLGVDVSKRHNAMADALIAARIFIALIPKLAALGIRTIGEAEAASRDLPAAMEAHHRAGWTQPTSRNAATHGASALQIGDPFAFRHRVADAMAADVQVAKPDIDCAAAIAMMTQKRISSLFLSDGGIKGAPIGNYAIVTERDVLRALAAHGAAALSFPAGKIATKPVISVSSSDFVYRAIGDMSRLKIRHLAVHDRAGCLSGVVSARDFLRLRVSAAADMHADIRTASGPPAMAQAWSKLPSVAMTLLHEDMDARLICEIVSDELCALTARSCELALEAMVRDGKGAPPCRYAVFVLGSGGRGESLLAADQDNALVFEEGEPGGSNDLWFAEFGNRFTELLHLAAVPLCPGGVMARNASWRGSMALWRERIHGWVGKARPEDLLNVDIFFDLRGVHGDVSMAGDLRSFAFELGHSKADFAKLLGESVQAIASPFTLFGGLRTEKGRIDLKLHGLFPIVAAARTLSIRHGFDDRSTPQRLDRLMAMPDGADEDIAALKSAHARLMTLLLDQQTVDICAGVPPSNRVETARLDGRDRTRLKRALQSVQVIPHLVRDMMFH